MSNAFTLLIIYARMDLTPWYIECLYCLLVVEEVIYQFKLKIGKLNEDLLQPSGIRYEVWSFSVRHLISISYWKGLISGVKLSIVVPQAIGISLRNRIGDSAGEFLVVVVWGFYIAIQWLWIALFLLFLCRVWGHVFLAVSDWCEVCLSLSVFLYFYAPFFLYVIFELIVTYTHSFLFHLRIYTRVYCEQSRMPLVFPFSGN